MVLKRFYDLEKEVKPGKVTVIFGPRRVGKTTLLQSFLSQTSLKYKLDSGENIRTQEILSSRDFNRIFEYVEGLELLALDEAQYIPDVGLGLKIMVDHRPNLRVIATGSSSFDLSHQIGEPLVGRKTTLLFFPLSQLELSQNLSAYDLKMRLEEFLIFGGYPEVLLAPTRKEKIGALEEIVNSYLLKDILSFDRIRGSRTIFNLLKLLAFQVGHEVSLNELSGSLDVNIKTVARYLDLLEKAFVIKSVGGLSRNLRKEIKSKYKYYFLDNGIRNGVASQFNNLSDRNDVGQLWENFLYSERLKKRTYGQIHANEYFWRTYDQQEIDLVEERDGSFYGFEFKWSTKKKVSPPSDWAKTYPNSHFQIINPENYLRFVG